MIASDLCLLPKSSATYNSKAHKKKNNFVCMRIKLKLKDLIYKQRNKVKKTISQNRLKYWEQYSIFKFWKVVFTFLKSEQTLQASNHKLRKTQVLL